MRDPDRHCATQIVIINYYLDSEDEEQCRILGFEQRALALGRPASAGDQKNSAQMLFPVGTDQLDGSAFSMTDRFPSP